MLGKSFIWNKEGNMIDIYNIPITDTKKSVVNKGKIITFPASLLTMLFIQVLTHVI